MKYYYLDEENQAQGPLRAEALVSELSDGSLQMETLVAEEGGEDWRSLKEVLPSLMKASSRPPVPGKPKDDLPRAEGRPELEFYTDPETSLIKKELFWSFFGVQCASVLLFTLFVLSESSMLGFLSGVMYLAAITLTLILHYKCWNRLPNVYKFTTPAKAVAFKEAQRPEFKTYQEQVLKNAKAIEKVLKERNINIISGGTDNHCMLIDLRNKNISGKDAEIALGKADITVNKNMVPFDDKSPFVTSGIRVGTPAITTRGLKVEDMKAVVDFIDEAINNADNEEALHEIGERVSDMMSARRLFVM